MLHSKIESSAELLPTSQPPPQRNRLPKYLLALLALAAIPQLIHHCCPSLPSRQRDDSPLCPQTTALVPRDNAALYRDLNDLYSTPEFKENAIDWLAGAVRIPTESYDVMDDVGVDPRWEVFGTFHDYLLHAYPHVHATLQLTKVNTYGLLYHWQGVDESLKPILLMAHQDVVPVEPITLGQWLHPPYSGFYDGRYIWGRGSADDKSGLTGILASIETLIKKGFKPRRTVVISMGFDEEVSGRMGAQMLAQQIEKTYGKDAFAFLVDEGSSYGKHFGTTFATPGIGEKGYFDAKVTVRTPGGHSSVPPVHTSIGILARLLVHLESHPFVPHLHRTSPTYGTIQCYGAHGKNVPDSQRKLIERSVKSDKALGELEKLYLQNPFIKAQIGTTQAVDLVQGGVKVNALPESAEAVVNHRIATESSVVQVQERYAEILAPLAQKFNLSFNAFGRSNKLNDRRASGTLTLDEAFGHALNPAPITPTNPDSEPWKLLSGTIISSFATSKKGRESNETIIVSPGISTGNTDTKYYWNTTRHIFRYGHINTAARYAGIHTVNEALEADAIVELIQFFTTLILNADESKTL